MKYVNLIPFLFQMVYRCRGFPIITELSPFMYPYENIFLVKNICNYKSITHFVILPFWLFTNFPQTAKICGF